MAGQRVIENLSRPDDPVPGEQLEDSARSFPLVGSVLRGLGGLLSRFASLARPCLRAFLSCSSSIRRQDPHPPRAVGRCLDEPPPVGVMDQAPR